MIHSNKNSALDNYQSTNARHFELSDRLIPTNKSRPCRKCGKPNGNCRHQSDGGIQCMSHLDDVTDPHWRWVKLTKCGTWGIYYPRTDNDFDREAWLQKKAERETREREVERQRLEQCLTPEQRHTEIMSIQDQLGLSNGDRQYLKARGVPDRIIANCRSVTQWQKLRHHVHVNLPGVSKYGNRLNNDYGGILVATTDHLGQFTGLRIHDRNAKTTDNPKYKPLGKGWKLPNGENPAATHYPDEITKPKTIGLCEGPEWKAPAAADRLGMVTMGFSGHNAIANSPQQIQATLDHTGATEIIIIPDDNCLVNESVYKSLITTIEYWDGKGYTVNVAWWGQIDKGVGDIDEIDGDRQISFIDKAGFEFQKRQAILREEHNKLNTLSLTPNILVNDRYFPSLAEMTKDKPLPKTGNLSITGPKGSGKTVVIKDVKKHYASQGYEVVSIVPTVSLGRAQGNVLDLQCRNDLVDTGMESDKVATCMRNMPEVVLCPESLHQIQGRDFTKPHLIILDECEQILEGIATSNTIKENRAKILKDFQDMIRTVLSNGGVVLSSDADLTDVSIDYIKELSGCEVPTFLIKNESKPLPWDIDFYMGGDHDVKAIIFDYLANGKRLVIYADSKNEAQGIAEEIRKNFPDKIIMEINSDTTEDLMVKNWVGDINKAIEDVKPDIVIHTSSLGTGVSIDIKNWFDEKVGLNSHFPPNNFCQGLARLREPIHTTICTKEYVSRDESHRSYRAGVVKRNVHKDKEFNVGLIDLANELPQGDGDAQDIVDTLSRMIKDREWDNPHINLFAKVKARKNYVVSQLRANLLAKLTEEGHNITIHEDNGPNPVSTGIKEAKKEIKLEESAAIANAPDLDPHELKRLQKKPTTTKEERAQITKALIKQELPGIDLTPEFTFDWIVSDRRKKLNATKLFFYSQNPAIAKQLDIKEWRYRLKQFGEGCHYLPDVKTLSTKVKAINDIGLFDLLDLSNTDREYRATDDDVQAFFRRCYFHRYRLNRSLGVTVTQSTEPMALLGRLARRVGLNILGKRYREGDDHVWVYRLDTRILENSDRANILKILGKKYAETQRDSDFSVGQNFSGESNKQLESSGPNFQPKIHPPKPSTLPTNLIPIISPTKLAQIQWDEIITTNDSQIAQLGWDAGKAGQILKERYGRRSRLKLSDDELFDWIDYCQAQINGQLPTPTSKFVG